MVLYLGSEKRKIVLNGDVYCLNLFSKTIITNNNVLLSSDGYSLKDADGLYLKPLSTLPIVEEILMSSSDDYIFEDINGMRFTFKESD